MKFLFSLIFALGVLSLFGQTTYSATTQLEGAYANEALPFWFTANTNGLKGPLTNVSGYAFAKANHSLSESSSIEVGAGVMYRDGFVDRFQRNELYVQFKNKWIRAMVGSKNPEIALDGLSTTNANILWSGNARAIPGVLLEAPTPLKLTEHFSIDYGLGHYFLNDSRYVENTRVHYKRLGVHWKIKEKHILKASLEHYAQWGGNSPEFGKLPGGFSDFVKVILAQNAGDNADFNEQVNAIGNHLGSYNVEYEYRGAGANFRAYHQHLFEDGSGTALKNFPDGVWGFTYAPTEGVLKRLLYEFVHTTDQSEGGGRSAGDNYFSNRTYRSGWTYEGATIGLPFIKLNPVTGLGISSNKIRAHHFGGLFSYEKWDLLVKMSLVKDFGSPSNQLATPIDTFLSYGQAIYHTTFGDFSLRAGLDTSSVVDTTYGVGAGYRYQF